MSNDNLIAKILIDVSEYDRLKRSEKELARLKDQTPGSNAHKEEDKQKDKKDSADVSSEQIGSGTSNVQEQVRELVQNEIKKALSAVGLLDSQSKTPVIPTQNEESPSAVVEVEKIINPSTSTQPAENFEAKLAAGTELPTNWYFIGNA